MVKGKKVLVFSPVSKGWGTSTTAIALCVMLEQEYRGRIELMDFYTEVSSVEHYIKKDMCKEGEGLPLEVFIESSSAREIMLFSRPISKNLYFLKVNCEKFKDEKTRKMRVNKLISDAAEIFDIVVIRADSALAMEIESNWDAGVSIFAYENGFESTFAHGSRFNWHRELLKKEECLKVVNGVPYEWGVRENLYDYICKKEKVYQLPYNGELLAGGNIGSRLYSGLREELLANKSSYSRKIGKLALRLLEIMDLAGPAKRQGEDLDTY